MSGNGHVAQTNLQLYDQILALGWADADIALVRRAYELAIELFSNRYRSNGKPFLAHLVGTGSILAQNGTSPPAVTAGLIHAAYSQGRFGVLELRLSARRGRVRRAIGDDAEDLLFRYAQFRWNPEARRSLAARLAAGEAFSTPDRELVLMRLANTLEDHLDGGMLYSAKGQRRRTTDEDMALTVELADRLGAPLLARALAEALRETASSQRPQVLASERAVSYSFPRTLRKLGRSGSSARS